MSWVGLPTAAGVHVLGTAASASRSGPGEQLRRELMGRELMRP